MKSWKRNNRNMKINKDPAVHICQMQKKGGCTLHNCYEKKKLNELNKQL